MKKIIAILLTAVLLTSVVAMMPLSASANAGDAPNTFMFGNTPVDIRIIEDYSELTKYEHGYLGSQFISNISLDGPRLEILSGSWMGADGAGLQSGMLTAGADFTGAVNIVFSYENDSDGDTWFNFQPHPTGSAPDTRLFLSPTGDPVWIVDEDGYAYEAEASTDAEYGNLSSRYAYLVPGESRGYIVVPVSLLCEHGQWGTSYFANSTLNIDATGYHLFSDMTTYLEMYIDDIFVCGELPEYQEPGTETEPSDTPIDTPPVDQPGDETEPLETQPAQDTQPADTQADETQPTQEETTADTTPAPAETNAQTNAPKKGCGGIVGVAAVLPILGGAVLVLNRKRDDE